jgi:hypothetical protein
VDAQLGVQLALEVCASEQRAQPVPQIAPELGQQ